MLKSYSKVTGGKKVKKFINKALKQSGTRSVSIGFFSDSKYPDGTPVPAVAAWQEFGTKRIPERPFMRPVAKSATDDVRKLVRRAINTKTMEVDPRLGDVIGGKVQGEIKKGISALRTPQLSETTIHIRRTRRDNRTTSDKPLIDTGQMRTSVTYTVDRKK